MRRLQIVMALACVAASGCNGVRARRETLAHAAADVLRRPVESHHRDGLDDLVLEREGLSRSGGDVQEAELASRFDARAEAGPALAMAERSFRRGRAAEGHSWGRAAAAYRDAAAFASAALDDPGPLGSRAVGVHNAAVERLVRLAWGHSGGASGREALSRLGIATVVNTPQVPLDQVENLTVAADYRVTGLSHHYASPGLGVPMVARRLNPAEARRTAQDRYYPPELNAATTAVLRVGPPTPGSSWRGRPLTLTLHDPFEERAVAVGSGRVLPLAADRSTPLAVQVRRDQSLRQAALGGALSSRLGRFEEGLVMLRPHRPGRIPVVFVHGLASSPLAWAETFNELANDPTLSDRYEFWTFLYATGEPVPFSAGLLRRALATARADFDPEGVDPAMGRMVVVGHSLGGLLAKTLAQDSGLTLWDAILNVPYPASRLPEPSRRALAQDLVYGRDAGVRRLVFVATPHAGSPVADGPIARLGILLARPKEDVRRTLREVRAAYGRGSYEGGLRGDALGLTNLRTSSPVVAGLRQIPLDPAVPHHSIILQRGGPAPRGPGDGLVPYASAHLDTAASETIVPGYHLDLGKPGVTDELRRILRLHPSANPEGPTPDGY